MPSNIISILKTKFAVCTCTSCEKSVCKLKFKKVPNTKIMLDVDCIATQHPIQGKRCDYIIAVMDGQSTFIIPVEFKTKHVDVEKVKEQLEGGMRFIQKYWQGHFVCHPVLVSKFISPQAFKKLQRAKIQYNGGTARIRRISCNQQLQWDRVKK